MKICIECHKTKEQTEFPKDNSKKDGLRSYCRECFKAYKANRALSLKELGLCIHCSNPVVPGKTCCIKCAEVQKAYRHNNKERHKEYNKEYYKEYKDRGAILKRLRKYNLTEEQYNELLIQQEEKCAICKSPMIKPYVDHCHKTGRVRGLLCQHCNTGIGMFKDSPELLIEAAKYVSSIK